MQDERLEKAVYTPVFLEKVGDSIYESLRARLKPEDVQLLDDLVLIWGVCRVPRARNGRVRHSMNNAAQRAVEDARGKVMDLYGVLKT